MSFDIQTLSEIADFGRLKTLGIESGASVITYIDGFGNIKTNIFVSNDFNKKDFLKVNINSTIYSIKVANTFSDGASGELLCYRGSNNTLEIAANLESAKDILKVDVGNRVSIEQ